MIAYVFIGIKLADIINMENNGKYDDYPFLAGRMAWNGFILVRIEAIIDMLLMRFHNSHDCRCACNHWNGTDM